MSCFVCYAGIYGTIKKDRFHDLWRNRMFDFRGFNDLIGTPEMLAKGERYADPKD